MTKVDFSKHFVKKFKRLNKKNKKLVNDIAELVKVLEEDPTIGVFLGNDIYKIRMANSSKNIGKRGGFRVITYYVDENEIVYLVEIYEKNAIENIPTDELIALVEKEFKGKEKD